MRSLKRRGLSENTVILYSSDHGLLMGEYGMGGKALLYDLTTRIPLVLFDPRLPKAKRGQRIEELAVSIDVAPTILSLAQVSVPQAMQGRSLMELVYEPDQVWREDIFLENLYVGRYNPLIEGVRTKRWKYVRYFKNPGESYTDEDVDFRKQEPIFEQLFDLKIEHAEVKNLAGNVQHAKRLKQLRARCKKYSEEMMKMRSDFKGNRKG